jgi:hypothetical protein
VGRTHREPAALVAWMGAIQAQDAAGARWAVAMRLAGTPVTERDILQALADGSVIRTHVMRWTWQLVAAGDLHWILPLVAPALFRRAARRFRELGLDDAALRRSHTAIGRALRDGAHLTRDELAQALTAAGVSVEGQRLSHLLGWAELEGLLCSGAPRGKSATYALLQSRAPRPASPLARDEALAELALRYFRSRGPATLPDFVWWSGLAAAEARSALHSVEARLHRETAGGHVTWRSPERTPATRAELAGAHLIPPFDELLIAYKDRAHLLDPRHARRLNAGGGLLSPAVVLRGQVAGTWRRDLAREIVAITVSPFERLTRADREDIAKAADSYGRFLGLKPALTFARGPVTARSSGPARTSRDLRSPSPTASR